MKISPELNYTSLYLLWHCTDEILCKLLQLITLQTRQRLRHWSTQAHLPRLQDMYICTVHVTISNPGKLVNHNFTLQLCPIIIIHYITQHYHIYSFPVSPTTVIM